jgi:hypothetical protein
MPLASHSSTEFGSGDDLKAAGCTILISSKAVVPGVTTSCSISFKTHCSVDCQRLRMTNVTASLPRQTVERKGVSSNALERAIRPGNRII